MINSPPPLDSFVKEGDYISINNQKLEVQRYLKSLYPIVKGDGIQYRTKCILCGDSKKDPNKMRLGIKVDPDNPEEPILYHCFNCERRGVLTNQMLQEIAGERANIITKMNVDAVNREILKSPGNIKTKRWKNDRAIKVTVPPLYRDPNSIRKAKYVFDRLGTLIDPAEYSGLKIIWSLKQFLKENNLAEKGEYGWLLEKDYVGFLSVYNDYIIFRDITGTHKMRYVKYNTFDTYDNSQCFYSIPGKVDLLSTADIHIKIAEGTFDTLSILYNVEDNRRDNTIYLSSSNSEFYTPLLHYFQKGLVGSNIFVDVYKDNNSKINYDMLRRRLKPYLISLKNTTVYYNGYGEEKDFGVPKERIQVETFL